MDEKLLTASELHHKNENFSVSYFLADLRRDRFSAYALSDEVEKMIANYDGRNTPENYLCISALVLNLFMDGELEKAQKIIDSIPNEGYYLHFLKIGLQLVNPLISWKEFIKHLNYLKSKKVSLKCFILTAGRPSILNGFNDFTRIAPFLEKHRELFIEDLECIYEKSVCPSVYRQCLAEYYYQIDKIFESELLVSHLIKEFNNESERLLLFAALYLQTKILLVQGKVVSAGSYIVNIKKYLQEVGETEFSYNVKTAKVFSALYEGKHEVIAAWMANDAPDEYADFNMLDLYRTW